MIFLVHQCDAKVCKENLVIDGSFDDNMEHCMAKESGYIEYDSHPGQIRMGCNKERQNLAGKFVKNISEIARN